MTVRYRPTYSWIRAGNQDHLSREVSALQDLHGGGAAVVSLSGGWFCWIIIHSKCQSWVQVGSSFIYVAAKNREGIDLYTVKNSVSKYKIL